MDDPVGNCRFSSITVFSFHPVKIITTGEGGMLTTNNLDLANKARRFTSLGYGGVGAGSAKITKNDIQSPYYNRHVSLGFNYRMTDFQAALGYRQIINYHKNLKARHLIAKRYIKNFSKTNKIIHMPYSATNSFFVFQIFCKNRDRILKKLKKKKKKINLNLKKPLPKI